MKNESYLIRKERCPRCSELGKDRTGDNLGIYSDGHSYCYSCGYRAGLDGIQRFINKQTPKEEMSKQTVFLPEDCDTNYPQRALDWCRTYEIQRLDLLNNNVLWSEQDQRLIFPVYEQGVLVFHTGRDFSLNKEQKRPKWLHTGKKNEVFNIQGKGNILILVEDPISAMKLVKCGYESMPLYCSVIGKRWHRLYSLLGYDYDLRIWLDPNKRSESIREARQGSLYGLHCTTVFSERDPKEHSYDEIKTILAI